MTDAATTAIEELRASHERQYEPYSQATIPEHLADIADRRERCPLSFSPDGGFWLATTYDDISGILKRNNRGFVSFPNIPDGSQAFGQKRQIPIELDGPIHREYRKLLDPLFSPARVSAMEPQVRQVAVDLIDEFIEKGNCEIVSDFGFPFPGTVFLSIMGWPVEDAEMMNKWVDVFLHGVAGATEEETMVARVEASTKARAYIQNLVDDRRANPRDDIMSTVVAAEIEGAPITDEDLSDMLVMLMMAGLDTVQSVISQGVAYFATHQDQWAEMFSSPEILDRAIEELLRWTSPAVPTRTVDDESAIVGDIEFPKGERIHCPLAAANRDPKYFPDPDAIDFHRERKPHLTFSLGAHRCIGIHLARQEVRIAFEELHRQIPEFQLAPGCEPKEHLALTWGVEDVRIEFAPGQKSTDA
jgi:cytochrome P450